jgi:hypothetical protein
LEFLVFCVEILQPHTFDNRWGMAPFLRRDDGENYGFGGAERMGWINASRKISVP